MVCPNCQAENRPGRKFCAQCGSALAAACPSCGAANQPGERFCGECGTALTGEPALRAAVGSGQAAVVIGAAGQGMVAGDLVNTASRLQAAALPGGLLVDERTYQASNRSILFEPVGEQNLKGKALPVPAFRALRVVAARRGGGRSERLEPPFVGRDEELRLLKELFHATAREKRARLISIVGQAGIGKSRLVWE